MNDLLGAWPKLEELNQEEGGGACSSPEAFILSWRNKKKRGKDDDLPPFFSGLSQGDGSLDDEVTASSGRPIRGTYLPDRRAK